MYTPYGFYLDWTYILVIIGAVISLIASGLVKSTFNKYSKVACSRRMTGAQVADMMLRDAGINDVTVMQVSGNLTDHYSSKDRALRLSESVYGSTSVAAIGVAAHECGHAIQDKEGYGPLKLRTLSVPLANIGSWISFPLIVIGLIFDWIGLARVGIIFFVFVVLFQLITLPVEFDASRRAMRILQDRGILADTELSGAGKVLRAAAMTYVAALISSVLQLLRLILLVRRRD
ncbi:MAG: zinc metallopeptidase [Lachnospiraceae bacterium]|nr:zinc metallopeptidase [Lachnospiraceae bacterium]